MVALWHNATPEKNLPQISYYLGSEKLKERVIQVKT
jgi:hypothetical protein